MKQAKVLTEKELKRVLSVAAGMRQGARNKVLVLVSHYLGLRACETAAMKMGCVYADDGSVRDSVYINPEHAKGGKGRTVFMNTKLIKALENYRRGLCTFSEPRSRRMLATDAPLIASQKRQHFTPNSLVNLFKNIYLLSGIDNATSHSGRRFFVTKLAHSGISLNHIRLLVGHADLSTTQRYIHSSPAMLQEAVEVL
jgi:integrase/recombinase XerD